MGYYVSTAGGEYISIHYRAHTRGIPSLRSYTFLNCGVVRQANKDTGIKLLKLKGDLVNLQSRALFIRP